MTPRLFSTPNWRSQLFWEKVEKQPGEDSCWLWMGCIATNGYGKVCIDGGQTTSAHRYAYTDKVGSPGQLNVCHTCDTRRCVRPSHLFLGTQSENILDAVDKGRHRSNVGINSTATQLTEEDVYEIRRLADEEKLTQVHIGQKFGIGSSAVSYIKRRVNWSHLPERDPDKEVSKVK